MPQITPYPYLFLANCTNSSPSPLEDMLMGFTISILWHYLSPLGSGICCPQPPCSSPEKHHVLQAGFPEGSHLSHASSYPQSAWHLLTQNRMAPPYTQDLMAESLYFMASSSWLPSLWLPFPTDLMANGAALLCLFKLHGCYSYLSQPTLILNADPELPL